MLPTLSPQEFVKWRSATLKERSAAQEHSRCVPPGRPADAGRPLQPARNLAGSGPQPGAEREL